MPTPLLPPLTLEAIKYDTRSHSKLMNKMYTDYKEAIRKLNILKPQPQDKVLQSS